MKTLKSIAILSISPALLIAWYFTQATQFLIGTRQDFIKFMEAQNANE